MTSILIVDDSPVDRQLVSGLIKAQSALDIRHAADGKIALDVMGRETPDIVVTDMHMPEMNGLKLVEATRSRFPHVPIVLITGQGSEELAVAALQAGAASYVPKTALQRDLVPTVMNVLSVARANKDYQRMIGCLRNCSWEFELENDFNLVGPLINLMRQVLLDVDICVPADRVQIGMVLEAALSNAIYHGNLELSQDELDGMTYDLYDIDEPSVVEQRQTQSPYRERRVVFTADITANQARFVIRDEGRGFDHATLPSDPSELLSLDDGQGRGLTHIRLFVDDVTFNERGNEITLLIRRKA